MHIWNSACNSMWTFIKWIIPISQIIVLSFIHQFTGYFNLLNKRNTNMNDLWQMYFVMIESTVHISLLGSTLCVNESVTPHIFAHIESFHCVRSYIAIYGWLLTTTTGHVNYRSASDGRFDISATMLWALGHIWLYHGNNSCISNSPVRRIVSSKYWELVHFHISYYQRSFKPDKIYFTKLICPCKININSITASRSLIMVKKYVMISSD